MAAGVVWVAALLAAMLSLPRLFAADLADGTLEQLLVSPRPLIVVVAAKTAAHWLLTGLPLALVAPLIGLQYHLPWNALGLLLASLLVGTPVLSLLGAAGAALVLGARGAGVLLGLLLLPLYVPVLVFGAGAVTALLAGIDPYAHLSLLGAFLAVSSLVGPWAACAALRVALD
jgi:heme exporter protein B